MSRSTKTDEVDFETHAKVQLMEALKLCAVLAGGVVFHAPTKTTFRFPPI